MALLRIDEFNKFDCALDGIGLMFATAEDGVEKPYTLVAPDLVIERQDTGRELDQNKLDSLHWGSNRSWHEGAGQNRFNMPEVSKPYAFLSSKGIDITQEGQATLLRRMNLIMPMANANPKMVSTDTYVYAAAGQPNLKRFSLIDASDQATVSTATETGQEVLDLSSDGVQVFLSLGVDGTHRAQAAGVFSHYSDWDSRVLGWAKDRLYGAGIKSGTQWRFFEVGSGATSTEIFALPDGYQVTDIKELGGFVYFTAYRASHGVIYAYDGTNPPFRALNLPLGDIPLMLTPFSGAGTLIGTRRQSPTGGTIGVGPLYRAFPTAAGHLVAERLAVLAHGTHDQSSHDADKDYGIRTGFEMAHGVHFTWSWADDNSCGLGIYLPGSGSYGRWLHADVAGIVVDALVFKGRHFLSIEGSGIWGEGDTYLPSGEIISSEIDLNVDPEKLWLSQESTFELKGAGSKVAHQYSVDGGVTWSTLQEGVAGDRLRTALNQKSRSIQYRTILSPSTDLLESPVLLSTGIGGWPAFKPRAEHVLIVRAYPNSQLRTGEQISQRPGGVSLANALLTRRDAGNVIDFQPPEFRDDPTRALKVRISHVEKVGASWGAGPEEGGLLMVRLKEAA